MIFKNFNIVKQKEKRKKLLLLKDPEYVTEYESFSIAKKTTSHKLPLVK